MAERTQCEFFLIRYAPDAVKNEFVNVGVAVLDPNGFADVRMTHDWRRVKCLDPAADTEVLEALEADLRSMLADPDRDKLMAKIRDSFSNAIQLTPAKAVLAEDPAVEIENLARMYLDTRRPAGKRELSARQAIFTRMRDAFEQAGVWKLMRKRIAVAKYTHAGDPLKIDCGYRPNGELKLFHAVSLASDVDAAKVLAFTYPQIREGIARLEKIKTSLTAIVEDDLNRKDEPIAFALDTLARSQIAVAAQARLPRLAEVARRELRV